MAIRLLANLDSFLNANKNLFIANKTIISDLILDASHVEDVKYSAKLTDHYVEDGSVISDHILLQPVSFSLEGSVSDDSLDIVGYAETVFTSIINNNVSSLLSNKGPKQIAAYQLLTSLVNSKTLVTVVAYLDTFTDMCIENLTFPVDANTGNRLFFKMDLKKANFARVKTVTISTATKGLTVNSGKNLQDMVTPKTNLGIQQTNEPNEKETANIKTVSAKWAGL